MYLAIPVGLAIAALHAPVGLQDDEADAVVIGGRYVGRAVCRYKEIVAVLADDAVELIL